MICKVAECGQTRVYGSAWCGECLPAQLERQAAAKKAYWQKYREKNRAKLNAYMRGYMKRARSAGGRG